MAARQLGKAKPAGAGAVLWEAYRVETDEEAGSSMADALIAFKFSDPSSVPFLLGRLDPKSNKLWYEDVRLLRHITKQEFGPRQKHSDEQERNTELRKWRQWGGNRQ